MAEGRAELSSQLARLGAGDRSCAQPVFDTLWPLLRRFCRRWVQNPADAEDCAQSAITRLFSQAMDFDPQKDPLAWALEIAVWECRTARNKLRRSQFAPEEEPKSSASAAPGPDLILEQKELDSALSTTIADLTQKDREVLQQLLSDAPAGNAAQRKQRERAVTRLKLLWKKIHGDH